MSSKLESFTSVHSILQTHLENSTKEYITDSRFKKVAALIIKVTHRCNLDCSYCYENITRGEDMEIKTFQLLVKRVMSSTSQKQVMLLFHGGEPTLLSNDWYIQATEYARDIATQFGKKVTFAMQSNILAIDEKKISLIKKLGIRLSVSIDGPNTIANAMRKRVDTAISNYESLMDAGINPGILMTINHSNFDKFSEICEWLNTQLMVKDFKANIVYSVGHGYNLPDLTAEHIFKAHKDILDYMINTEGGNVIEDNLAIELARFFASPAERLQMPKTLCRDRHCGAGERVIGVTPDGNLLPCGRFQWNNNEYYLGNLKTIDEPVYYKAIERFHNLVPQSWYDCDSCKARNICSYGCQSFIVQSKSKANIDCLPTKMRHAYYAKNEKSLISVVEEIRKRELAHKEKSDISMGYTDGGRDAGYTDYSDKGYKDYSDTTYTDKYYDYRDRNDYYDYTDKQSDPGTR